MWYRSGTVRYMLPVLAKSRSLQLRSASDVDPSIYQSPPSKAHRGYANKIFGLKVIKYEWPKELLIQSYQDLIYFAGHVAGRTMILLEQEKLRTSLE